MTQYSRLGSVLVLVLGGVLGSVFGCSSEPKPLAADAAAEQGRRSMMQELGEMLHLYKGDYNKPPKAVADLTKFEAGFQIGYLRLKDGEIVLLWGAPLQEGATDKILAYEKAAPEAGGYVLMQDGVTVKKLTADEFKAAPKAPGSPTPAAKSGKSAK